MSGEKILVVDDDPRICNLLSRYLKREGYQTLTARNGKETLEQHQNLKPDLIILDLVMPGEDGLQIARRLRVCSEVPIIMLTGKGEAVDKIVGLEIGADDYIVKPFDERELLARIHAVLRRSKNGNSSTGSQEGVAHFAGWTLNLNAHELRSPGDEQVILTSREFILLETLVKHSGQVLTRQRMSGLMSGREWNPSDRSIDVLIGKLRKKLDDDPSNSKIICSIRGVGYKFIAPVQMH